jgi:hypothetical protein
VRGETIVITLSAQDAGYARDALAKFIYGQLFSWLVGRINFSVPGDVSSQGYVNGGAFILTTARSVSWIFLDLRSLRATALSSFASISPTKRFTASS